MVLQDVGKFRINNKDQFYTKPIIAHECIDIINKYITDDIYTWIEPSAGFGSFSKLVKDCISLDIDPKDSNILQQNFLEWSPPQHIKNFLIFGNPPFGKQSSLAKSFIRHSCNFASIIAFILPKSFVKPSMSNSFSKCFHLVHTSDIKKNSFEVDSESYDVPCIFQIWERRNYDRIIENKIKELFFKYVKVDEDYDFVCRRVGGLAGKCYHKENNSKFNPQCYHFIKLDLNINLQKIIDTMNNHVFPSNTVGPRSLSKSEINKELNRIIESSQNLNLL